MSIKSFLWRCWRLLYSTLPVLVPASLFTIRVFFPCWQKLWRYFECVYGMIAMSKYMECFVCPCVTTSSQRKLYYTETTTLNSSQNLNTFVHIEHKL